MTLILTEVSSLGIAMAADSLISKVEKGKIVGSAHWRKLLKVPRIYAAISYWGFVGPIGKEVRFDEWLEKRIRDGDYSDLSSLADYLAAEMNHAAGDKPLKNYQAAGIHVAGIQRWADGVCRPTLYHVHNGDLQPVLRPGQTGTIEIVQNLSPREPFSKHEETSAGNSDTGGSFYLRNGDYVPFHVISEGLNTVFQKLQQIPEISARQKPQTLGKRIEYLKSFVEISIRIYRLSSLSSIGGEVLTVGIRPDGSYLN